MPEQFYVYLYKRDGIPVYVGKGCGDRWSAHGCRKSANVRLRRMILKDRRDGTERITREKVAVGLTETDAFKLEIELIARFGRAPTGTLVNMTSGGEGLANPSSAVRAAISRANTGHKRLVGFKHSQEFREKRRELARGNQNSRGSSRSGAIAEKISKAKRGVALTEAHKAKISASQKGRPLSSEIRAKMKAARKGNNRLGYKHSSETIEKMRAAALRRHTTGRADQEK